MITIENKKAIESNVANGQSLTWYDPVRSEDYDDVFFVGTIMYTTAKIFFSYPPQRIVIIEKRGEPKGRYNAIFFDTYLKFTGQATP